MMQILISSLWLYLLIVIVLISCSDGKPIASNRATSGAMAAWIVGNTIDTALHAVRERNVFHHNNEDANSQQQGSGHHHHQSIPPPFHSLNHHQHRLIPAVRVTPQGEVYTTSILKQQLANELHLPLRDLRIVDPSYPSQIQATFIARPDVILFTIENIKIVLKHNEALVFSPYDPEVQRFIPVLQQYLIESNLGSSSDNTKDSEVLENDKCGDPSTLVDSQIRFEHIVIEAALHIVCNELLAKVRALEPAVASALIDLRAVSRGLDVIQTQVDELLPLKNELDELLQRTKEIERAITEVLNSDIDMKLMFLKSVEEKETLKLPDVNTISLEIMFENYLNEIEWIGSEVKDINDEIKNTEENVGLQLDLLRNRILKFELMLSIASFVVTCGALVTGLFGMNLLSHLEHNENMFYLVSIAIVTIMFTIYRSFSKFASTQKLL